jgi:hypothetical protein
MHARCALPPLLLLLLLLLQVVQTETDRQHCSTQPTTHT